MDAKNDAQVLELVPKIGTIRRVMDQTGWSAYDTYCHFYEMRDTYNASFEEIRNERLWNRYKEDEAAALMSGGLRTYQAELGEDEFNALFYNERQRKAIDEMKSGRLTLRILCNYMKIMIPEGFDSIKPDENIVDRLAFRPNQVKAGSIYFCPNHRNADPELFLKDKPALIIGEPMFEECFNETGIPYICRRRLQSNIIDICGFYRSSLKAKVVAVTGSYGKTSSTEMIATVCENSLKTNKAWNNYNILPWIQRYMMNTEVDADVFVQECSGAGIGKLEKITRSILPDIFVITNVGTSHIEDFDGNREMLLHEKVAFDRYASEDAIGIVNYDDPMLRKTTFRHRIITYSLSDASADYHAENISEQEGRTTCDIVSADGRRVSVTINLFGVHNIYNAMIAYITGTLLGIKERTIIKSISRYRTSGIRQNLVSMNGCRVYLDCFNATDGSIKAALETAASISVPKLCRKLAVIGDVLGVGALSEEMHRRIGGHIADIDSVDKVFLYGESSLFTYEELVKREIDCVHSNDWEELLSILEKELSEGDLVVFKASHGMQLHRMTDRIFGTSFYIEDELTHGIAGDKSIGGNVYRAAEGWGCCLINGDRTAKRIILPSKLPVNEEGKVSEDETGSYDELKYIAARAFENAAVRRIKLSDNITCINHDAFRGCRKLSKVKLPAGLLVISPDTFAGCERLRKIEIPEGTTTIGLNAFGGCRRLRKIRIPESVKSIEEPFDEESKPVIICRKDSFAYRWASENGFRIKLEQK